MTPSEGRVKAKLGSRVLRFFRAAFLNGAITREAAILQHRDLKTVKYSGLLPQKSPRSTLEESSAILSLYQKPIPRSSVFETD
jgi:hypothetical protein